MSSDADRDPATHSTPQPPTPELLRFGVFELEPQAERLTRQGARVKLQAQPLRLLTLLARRSGELVTREEIQQHLWGDDTHVDFDQGINACVRQVRQALGDDASSPRFVETVPRKGYRFLAEVERVEPAETSARGGRPGVEPGPGSAGGPVAAAGSGRRPVPWGWIAALAPVLILGLVLLTAYLVLAQWDPGAPRQESVIPAGGPAGPQAGVEPERPLVLVVPFEAEGGDTGGGEETGRWLAEALTTELVTELQRTYRGRLRVIGRTTTLALRDGSRDPVEAADGWGVDHLVEGTVEPVDDGFRVRASLSSLTPADGEGSGAGLGRWATTYDETGRELPGLERRLAGRIALAVAQNLGALGGGGEGGSAAPAPDLPPGAARRQATTGPEAWEAYLRGRARLTGAESGPGDVEAARVAFRRAISLDPGFALAHAGLAAALRRFPHPPDWREELGRALETALSLDPELPEAYLHRGSLRFYWEWDLEGAAEDWLRALELAPSYAEARHALAAWYSVRGEHGRAMETVEEAFRLDPLSPEVVNDRGWYAYFARDYELAAERCRETRELDPDHPWVPQCLLLAGLGAGDLDTALEGARGELERQVRLRGRAGPPPAAGTAAGSGEAKATSPISEEVRDETGETREAALERTLRSLLEVLRAGGEPGTSAVPSLSATFHMALGEEGRALDQLEAAARARSGWILPFLGVHPLFDPLRDEPRFRRLEKRILGSPPAGGA